MSDALSDIAKAEREKIEFLSAIDMIAKYIAVRAINRPPSIREKYLTLAYEQVDTLIQTTTNDLLEEVTQPC